MEAVLTDDQIRDNVATNVRRLLRLRGWSQDQLAAAIGEEQSKISRICNARNMIAGGTLFRIAEALDASADRILAPPPEAVLATKSGKSRLSA